MLLLFVLLLAAGCEREDKAAKYRPGGPYYSQLDASGRRVVVRDAEGKPLLKVRKRDDRFKVFDAQMRGLGFVLVDRDQDPPRVLVRSLDGSDEVAFERKSDAVWELPGHLRVEVVDRGWAVFDARADLLAYIDRSDDGQWSLRSDYSAKARLVVDAKTGEVNTTAGKTRLRAPAGQLAAPVLLATAIEGLDNLERVALGLWAVELGFKEGAPAAATDAGGAAVTGDAAQGTPDAGRGIRDVGESRDAAPSTPKSDAEEPVDAADQ